MKHKAETVVAIALSEVGYHEKATDAALDDPVANAGSGNWTKYARDLSAAGYYNGNKNGFAWCDVFVDWCFYQAFGPEGQRVQCQTGDLGAACATSAQYYREQGRYDREPRPGDQVFFCVSGAISHTGLVVEVTERSVTVVEGNSSDRVQKLTYDRGSVRIAGYGHPRYDEEEKTRPQEARPKSVTEWVNVALPLLKQGMTGAGVKSAQTLLIHLGGRCGGRVIFGREVPDGDFGPVTEDAVKAFQRSRNLEPDGIIGADTWTSLLTE